MHVLAWALLAASGVADPATRFAPVPEPPGPESGDPCRERGPVGRWVPMSATGAPASIHNESWLDSAAVWTGTHLVVERRRDGKWNGDAFDPCGNAWSRIAEAIAPAPAAAEPWRTDGDDRQFHPSSGGSYDAFERIAVWDAARKSWVTVTAAAAVPAPRAHYAVALAGRRLLVWGGWVQNRGDVGDGAVLDLAHKSWRKMSAAGAPSPRFDPAAVAWTGTRLVVWGGRQAVAPGSSRMLGDGAQYDPATDRWTAMSSVNAPSPRSDATTVWTGRKLVVLGGADQVGGGPVLDGGIYDPATDRWTRLGKPPGGVELPRGNIGPLTRILVTPDGRVVFLPNGLGQVLLLDADRAAWSSIAADGPGKRDSFRAFLLGRRLIVWGGVTVVAEHRCPPPVPGQPLCDPFAETAPHDDGWMIVLPR